MDCRARGADLHVSINGVNLSCKEALPLFSIFNTISQVQLLARTYPVFFLHKLVLANIMCSHSEIQGSITRCRIQFNSDPGYFNSQYNTQMGALLLCN